MEKIVLELLNKNKIAEARHELTGMKIVDIAQMLEETSQQNLLKIIRILPKEVAAGVFSHMSMEQQKYIIESITDKEIEFIVQELFLDDTIDFLEEMPANVVKKVLKNTDENTRRLINQFLNYPEHSAGSIMTIEYVDLKKEMTVEEAIKHIKRTGIDKETINTCYCIGEGRKLEGVISIRKIILSESNVIIKNIMETSIIYAHTHDDQEMLASLFRKYDLTSLPVVDNECRLVGIVTIDDIVDIIDQENTEDFQRMAAMEPSEEEYLKTSPLVLAKHRIIWLLVLMISATFTGRIIRKFEGLLQSAIILTNFIPMLMDTGGNSGSQSSTLVIRGLALGEIKLKDIFKVLRKEFTVSLIVASTLSVVNFLRLYFFEKCGPLVSLTVCISLFATVIIAKIVGGALPIIAKKLKLDPAIMASPLITTIVDALALTIYFSTATWILGI